MGKLNAATNQKNRASKMTRLLIILVLLVLTSCGTSDKDSTNRPFAPTQEMLDRINQQSQDSPLVSASEKDTLEILMGCGVAGINSKQFGVTERFVLTKNYGPIRKNLKSSDKLSQIISVVALEELGRKKLITLTEQDEELVSNIKKMSKKFYVCIGCTGHEYGIVSDIFENKCQMNVVSFIRFKIGLGDK